MFNFTFAIKMFKNLTFFSGKYKEGEKSVVKQIFFLSFFNYGYQTLIFLTSPDVLISETLYFVIILLFFLSLLSFKDISDHSFWNAYHLLFIIKWNVREKKRASDTYFSFLPTFPLVESFFCIFFITTWFCNLINFLFTNASK